MKKFSMILMAGAVMVAGCSKGDSGFPDSAKYDASYAAMEADQPGQANAGDRFDEIIENPFVAVANEPQSTFSVDADGASYAYFRRCIEEGYLPQANAVRIEEFLNYFTFDYPNPKDGGDIALNAEVGPCPWMPEHRLMRLGIKGKSLNSNEIPMANYVFLIDISGSMMSEDKLPLLKTGLLSMLEGMRPNDRVAIVTYASGEKLVLESTPVSEKEKIINAIKPLYAGGSTAGAKAMEMAYDQALKHYVKGANNRIIMGTDGDFNVGVTSTDALVEMVESKAKQGIYLTVLGFGTGNLNDSMMEQISNHGNGTYHYIDSELEMEKVFVMDRERFVSVANDCKVQITFNPEAVEQYRLIGYENRMLRNEDFEDDTKDAAEIGAGQTITALYEIIPAANATEGAACGTFDFRYKKALGGESVPLSLEIPAPTIESPSGNLLFAASLAACGLSLRNSEYRGDATLEMAFSLAAFNETCIIDATQSGLRAQYRELLSRARSIQQRQ